MTTPRLAEETAREAAERLAFVANALPALLAYVDTAARYVWVNDGYRRWFGGEVVGRRISDVLGAAGWANVRPYVERALLGEEVTFENQLVSAEGSARMLRASYVPHRDAEKRVRGFVVMVSDVTEMRAVETALRRSERMLEQSQATAHVGAWEVTLDETMREVPGTTIWSRETYRILAYDPGTPASLALFYRRVHPEDRAMLQAQSATGIERAESFEAEHRIACPDQGVRVIHLWLHFERAADGKTTRAFGTCQDITERKAALDELRETDRRKDEFLAMLSHELRNPLAPILSAVTVLQRLGQGNEKLADAYRTVIARQARNMKRLLDDLLDVSRVSQGKIQLQKEPVDLNALLQQALEVSRPLLEDRRHALSLSLTPEPLVIEADPTRLVQVFANLINNAAKYSDPGGNIIVTSALENGEAVVTVLDDGDGMAPELLTRAFDLFAQGTRALDRAQGGLGIGLTLVRTLVNMHGGSVAAFSEGPGHGSELVVRLPVAQAAEPVGAEPAPKSSDPPSPPLRVLVVDDNFDAASALGVLLRILGHEVVLAHDGAAALAAATAESPDLVLLDIGMPGMDGYAIAAQLRAAGHRRPVLVAQTGYGHEDHLRRSRDAGFDHHLVKPIDVAQLEKIILEVTQRRSDR